MSKQTNINTRLKLHINNLEFNLSPMRKTFHNKKNEPYKVSFKGDLGEFNLLMAIYNGEELLPIEEQTLQFTLKDHTGEYQSSVYPFNETKELFNSLSMFLYPIRSIIGYSEDRGCFIMPKIKEFLFDFKHSQEDKETFIKLFQEQVEETVSIHKNITDKNNALENSIALFEKEFEESSQAAKIMQLKNKLKQMEKEEEELKERLTKKHNLTHQENVLCGLNQQKYQNYEENIKKARDIMSEHKLSFDFYDVSESI